MGTPIMGAKTKNVILDSDVPDFTYRNKILKVLVLRHFLAYFLKFYVKI